MSWPPNSPDLNPIEHIWDVNGRQLRVQTPPIRIISDLHDHCLNIWYNLSPAIYQGLVASMPRWVEAVLRAKETLTFICLDHEGFTFSITLFLDGIRYLKLSSCCVFRYSPGKRLGGSSGCFSIQDIQGGNPCLKCQYRQIGSDDMDFKKKFIDLENTGSLDADASGIMVSNFNQKNFEEVAENGDFINHKYENNTEEDRASSVTSEIIHSPSEEIGENSIIDANQDIIDTDVIEDIVENDTNISIDENLNVSVTSESSNDSESSINSIADSVKNVVRAEEFQVKPYESENSDEDEEVKEYVVVASVHGSPSNS
ncbi:uncharacterized protein TNCV_708981 [Trichonephila clavipes]|nr:uncharacterized protein TNCV_708981 [Trichonephila clavipes]